MNRFAALFCALAATGCTEALRWEQPRHPPVSSWPSGGRAAHRQSPQVSEPGPDEYQVRPGDTVYSIAFRNQLDVRELERWNSIGDDHLIHTGQILRLKASPAQVTAHASADRTQPGTIQTQPLALPPPAPEVQLKLRWQWPTAGTVARSYAPGEGAKGLDIGGELGQRVVAAAPGKVVYSGSALKGYGELIIIKHDDVYLSAYGYNRKRLVQEGQSVTAGQPIAELGSGPEQKPVLHFEIRERGRPVNPRDFLPAPPIASN